MILSNEHKFQEISLEVMKEKCRLRNKYPPSLVQYYECKECGLIALLTDDNVLICSEINETPEFLVSEISCTEHIIRGIIE